MFQLFIYTVFGIDEVIVDSQIKMFKNFADMYNFITDDYNVQDFDYLDFKQSHTCFSKNDNETIGFYWYIDIDNLKKERVKNETLINFIQRNE